jgi:putative hydrolase of the HAD superfamily
LPHRAPAELETTFRAAYAAVEARVEAGELSFDTSRHFRARVWEETLQGYDLSPEIGLELADVYRAERRRRYRLYEETEDVLEALSRDYTLVLVTNGPSDFQREKIAAVKLERWFSRIVVSGELGHWKPAPEIFHHALALAGAAPTEALMVGDSLRHDIAGARAAGLHTLWVRRYPDLQPAHHASEAVAPHFEAAHLRDLPALAARLP